MMPVPWQCSHGIGTFSFICSAAEGRILVQLRCEQYDPGIDLTAKCAGLGVNVHDRAMPAPAINIQRVHAVLSHVGKVHRETGR
jgi:hypothetical protein